MSDHCSPSIKNQWNIFADGMSVSPTVLVLAICLQCDGVP